MNKAKLEKLLTDAGYENVYDEVLTELNYSDLRYSYKNFVTKLMYLCRTSRYESEKNTYNVIELLLKL